MSLSDRYAPSTGLSRNAVIALSVVTLHVAALWALQSGLMRKAAEIIIPAEVLSEFLTPQPPAPPAPPTPPPPHPPPPAPPKPSPTPPKPRVAKPTPAPEPMPVAIADPTPAPAAPVGVVEPQPAAKPVEAPVAAAPAPAAPPAPAIVQPSSDASHLNNPKPVYPAVSKRLGEQGKIVLRVLIGADGIPQKVEIKQSSGFERLDRQAVDTVTRWRFVPGTRNGVPEAMWYLQPINFVLQQ
ncbi:MAG: energy transducer TonB [Alicycliphilus sp.]|nr:MAG: energy transducer TonB [Alicycliphilus sp.]